MIILPPSMPWLPAATRRLPRRACDLGQHCSTGVHTWELLNPATGESYRRGRVVFLCPGRSRRRDARGDA